MLHIIMTSAQVNHLEDEINTLYKVLSFALPLCIALALSIAAGYFTVVGAIKKNSKNINSLANSTNGTLLATKASVDAMHRRLDTIGVQEGYVTDATSEDAGGGAAGSPPGAGTVQT